MEAYTHEEALHIIHCAMAKELYRIFNRYQPMLTEEDFLVMAYGSAELMCGYTAIPCTESFPLEKKREAFLFLALCIMGSFFNRLRCILNFRCRE